MKKGMMWGTVTKAIIVTILIVVVFFIATNKFGIFNKNIESCEAKNGYCVSSSSECDGQISTYNCDSEENNICCIEI